MSHAYGTKVVDDFIYETDAMDLINAMKLADRKRAVVAILDQIGSDWWTQEQVAQILGIKWEKS